MINVTVGDNLQRTNKLFPPETTLKEIFEWAEVDYSRGGATLNGATLRPGDIDRTLADFNVTESCFLLAVTKADNA